MDAAETKLGKLDEARRRAEMEFRRRQDELDAPREAAQVANVEKRKAAAAVVAAPLPDHHSQEGSGRPHFLDYLRNDRMRPPSRRYRRGDGSARRCRCRSPWSR